jgi:tetratricopeptide (TPR) repeat protein
LYYKGLCLHYLQSYDDAIRVFDKAIEVDEAIESVAKHHYPWFYKGLDNYYLGNYNEAIKYYNKSIELNHNHRQSWFNGIFNKQQSWGQS